jgi:hypothetical protein
LETDVAIFLTLFEGEQRELSKLLGNIFLGKFPIAHKPLRSTELAIIGKTTSRTGES